MFYVTEKEASMANKAANVIMQCNDPCFAEYDFESIYYEAAD